MIGATQTSVTDAAGFYSLLGLTAGGTYTVVPSTTNNVVTPSSRTYTAVVSDQANQNYTYGKLWTGGGSDSLASNPNNWSGLAVPVSSDVVRFDATNSTKTCTWDLTVYIEALQIKVSYSSSVVAVADMMIGTVSVDGGEFLLGAREIQIAKNFVHTGGNFRFAGGTARWTGSSVQTVSMVKNSPSPGHYDSYFSNFRVDSSSTVRANSDLIIDETFNISQGRFEAMSATHTMTGGTQSGAGGTFNWDASAGSFASGSGAFLFDSEIGGTYQLKQGGSNFFNNVMGVGPTGLTATSNLTVGGNLTLGGNSSTVHFNSGNGFAHTIAGSASIGPASTSGPPTFLLGTASTVTFQNGVLVGTATLSVQSGIVNITASSLTVTGQGSLTVPSGKTGRFAFWNGTNLKLNGGTLLLQGPSVFTSTAVGVTRFSTNLNGTVNIQSSAIFDSMDANGLRMGVGAVPTNLNFLDFRDGVTGGTALNFDPVTLANITVDSPIFDVTMSTNVRAILDTAIISNSDIDVIRSTGAHDGPAFEVDPSSMVNWGTIGTPTGFTGTAITISTITWSWTTVNHPYGFVVKSSTNGVLSPALTFSATYWTEGGLQTNTQYTRLVEAFTDSVQADSALVSRYTTALPASNLLFTEVDISSLTFTWSLNGNPAPTTFLVERSTDDVTYTQLSSGTIGSLSPYTDTGLTPEIRYYYKIETLNGDGVLVNTSVKSSTVTLAVPPPSVFSITPSTVANLHSVRFSIRGSNIQTGATVRLKRSATQVISSTDATVTNSSTMTASFNMTGALATAWDVEIENPDGKTSLGTGAGILTVTDAVSAAPVTIQNYISTTGVTFTTLGNGSTLSMAAGAMSDGRVYVSVDPQISPMILDPSKISAATAALSGWTLIPGTIREILAYTSQGLFSTGFGAAVNLSISYPDQTHDGVVDNAPVRASTVRMMNLNETNSTWQLMTASAVDPSNNRVISPLSHFSVYALFGSPAAATLAEVKIYPSPWKIGSSGKFGATMLTIANLTQDGTIRIYTLEGKLVKAIPFDSTSAGVATWDGKKEGGEQVKSGVYLVSIESSDGEKRTLKVGIER